MKSLMTQIALLAGCLSLSACILSENPEKEPTTLTKAQAKKIQHPKGDLCEMYDWYGDGQCDDFCESPDPDCATCEAYPACPAGYAEVSACTADLGCMTQTLCGTTIFCERDGVCLVPGVEDAPAQIEICMDGYEEVDRCDPSGSDCYEMSGYCGGRPRFCQAMATCLAIPVCPEDTYEVDVCPFDAECFEQTLCGTTITCASDYITCDAVPVCPGGTVMVDSCPQDVACYEETICGTTIYCADEGIYCDAIPTCGDGYFEVDKCPSDANCYEETLCGTTISCMEGAVNCLAYPTCPQGTQEVMACDPNVNKPCVTSTMCGVTIVCQ